MRKYPSIAVPVALLALMAFSCAVGPDYKRPETPSQDVYRGQTSPAESASMADYPWWDVFKDETLKELIKESLQNNQDLLIAAAKVEQYQALLGVAKSDFYPQLNYQLQGLRGQNVPGSGIGSSPSNYFAGNLNLNWEIDIWGRIRRSTEAAKADMMSTEWARRAIVVSLVASVAQAYFELIELDRELEIATNFVSIYKDTYDLFNRKYVGGTASKIQTTSAAADWYSARANVPSLEDKIFQKENQINLLLGRTPRPIKRGINLVNQATIPSTPAGLPSTLLERRPDIVSAEEGLRSSNAKIGAAKAKFFPTLSLSGLFGAASQDLQTFSMAWMAGGAFSGPAFDGFKVYDNYAASKTVWEQSKQSYIKAVLNALSEVANALTDRVKLADVRKEQMEEVEQLREYVRIANLRYIGGLADYFEVLQALDKLMPAEFDLSKTQRDQLIAYVNIYKALGGGWDVQSPETAQQASGSQKSKKTETENVNETKK